MSAAARFELAPSPALAGAVFLAHLAAAAAVCACLPGVAGIALAAAFAALGVAVAWSRALLRSASSIQGLDVDAERAVFRLRDGRMVSAPVAKRRYVSRHLVTLTLGRPLGRTLLVTRDMLGAREFRRLRLWSLWGRLPSPVAPKQLPA